MPFTSADGLVFRVHSLVVYTLKKWISFLLFRKVHEQPIVKARKIYHHSENNSRAHSLVPVSEQQVKSVTLIVYTLTRHSWIHYTDCWIVNKTVMLLQQSIELVSIVYTCNTYLVMH